MSEPSYLAKEYPPLGSSAKSFAEWKNEYNASIEDIASFWGKQANRLDWFAPYQQVLSGDFREADVAWFTGGKLNMCYNAVDRHVATKAEQVALVWEGDEPTDVKRLTYRELLQESSRIANALQALGVKKGDVVTVYMPMIPELPLTLLACARMGAIHSVVFAGFSAEALAQRIAASKSQVVVTADIAKRGGKTIPLKDIVDEARNKLESDVRLVLVWCRGDETTLQAALKTSQDVDFGALVQAQRPYCPPAWMDAEDPLFILYTSGSTGQPKGLMHSTGGYALFAAYTTATTFALEPNDLFACVADCGWITGHTYVVYGALLNGSTTFVFESTPVYPDPGRYWDMVERHKITQFYTAPTAIRLLMRYGDAPVQKYDLSSLKVLGSVGEPINPEAWRWYYQVVGRSQCTVVDTYWQTETGGHVITNIPGITPMKPASCTVPLCGIDPVVLDPLTGEIAQADEEGNTKGVLAIRQPWPGMARTCLGDHPRYMQTYLTVYKGYYFTGDSVVRDKDGFHFIIGRVDDVLNVSGHRIGTAEVESALVAHADVAQAAVVGKPHEIKGQAIAAFVMLKEGKEETPGLIKELNELVRSEIGKFASPDLICVAPSLPMTRSGKIMRRILRKIVCNEVDQLGDTSTLADPSIVDWLVEKVGGLEN